MNSFIVSAALALAFSFTSVAIGDVECLQPSQIDPNGPDGQVSLVGFMHIADDFQLTRPAGIASVRWWGVFQPIVVTQAAPDGFRVAIIAGDGSNGAPGSTIAEWTPRIGEIVQTPTDRTIGAFSENAYDFSLPQSIQLAGTTPYWITIEATISIGTTWIWSSSFAGNGASSVQYGSDAVWQPEMGPPHDYAVQLSSIPSGSTGTFGLAFVLLARRRARLTH